MSSLDVRSIDIKELRTAAAPATKQEYRVFLSETAFDRAVARGDSDTTREIGGVLIGELLRDDAGPYLRIDGTIDALHAEEKGAELTFTHATWEHIHKEMDGKHQDKRVVGWYHTHPGFGIFLSDRDQFIHKSFFNLPFQVALVYDPKSREHGMFTWHDNEVWRARRYWIGAREQTWDGLRAQVESQGDKPGDKPRPALKPDAAATSDGGAPRDDLGMSGSMFGLVAVGLVLLVVGGLVGRWLGAGAANEVILQAQVEVAKARSEGSQLAIASLQNELIGVLRDTMGDEAMRAPILEAVGDLDRAIAALPHDPAPAVPPVVPAGAGSGSAVAAAPVPIPAAPTPAEPLPLAAQLRATRDSLLRLVQGRGTAAVVLTQLERASRHTAELRADLGHDVAEQRAGLGTIYAELASDAIKAKDLDRARRLLATAAHLDPGNRARYEQQLLAFDKAAALPRETEQGAPR